VIDYVNITKFNENKNIRDNLNNLNDFSKKLIHDIIAGNNDIFSKETLYDAIRDKIRNDNFISKSTVNMNKFKYENQAVYQFKEIIINLMTMYLV
jgi:hypothetical protein